MKNFKEKEKTREYYFSLNAPYWHAFTSGKDTPIIFVRDDDFKFVMNTIALASSQFPKVMIIAFEVMNNHFHFVLSATREEIVAFWKCISKRLGRHYPIAKDISLSIKAIENLQSLRNSIAYTHRNGYVANPDYTPFSYPWGSGGYYFLDRGTGTPMSQFNVNNIRNIFRCRTAEVPENWQFKDGFVIPASYCNVNFGMLIFRDAHHYFSSISKNVEAYSGVAVEIDDGQFLTDSELYSQLCGISQKRFGTNRIKDLSRCQRVELSTVLHYDYRSSNNQIRRVLGLSKYEVDALFPLSADSK